MKSLRRLLLLCLFFSCWSLLRSQSYFPALSRISSGGGQISSSSYRSGFIVGEPAHNRHTSSMFEEESGFWPPVPSLRNSTLFSQTFESGWNMVAVPRTVPDYLLSVLYPAAKSKAYSYEGGYRANDTLRNSSGYWIKFDAHQTLALTGTQRLRDSVIVHKGWNIIGSISVPVPVAGITSAPPGIVTSSFFGYTGAYATATVIDPGRAYWVKVDQDGRLVLSSSGAIRGSNRIRIMPTEEKPPNPPGGHELRLTANLPENFGLEQNYPNPFNPSTVIRYRLPVASIVTLRVYDLEGREVASLVGAPQEAGFKEVRWDASGSASGVYVVRMIATAIDHPQRYSTEVKRMLLLK